jgi:hypothetical protein
MGLLAGSVVSGGAAVVRLSTPDPPRAPATAATHGTATREPARASAARDEAPVATAPTLPERAPRPTTTATRLVPAGPAASAPAVAALPDQSSALAQEVARIDEARLALRGADPRAALAALARYDEERQTGVLDREAAVLRIEALRRSGEMTQAKEHARRYLRRYPADAHAGSLRQLLDEGDGAQGIDR